MNNDPKASIPDPAEDEKRIPARILSNAHATSQRSRKDSGMVGGRVIVQSIRLAFLMRHSGLSLQCGRGLLALIAATVLYAAPPLVTAQAKPARHSSPSAARKTASDTPLIMERPLLESSDAFGGNAESLHAVHESQIRILQRLIDATDDSDPEKPDYLFRMGELYAEQERYLRSKHDDAEANEWAAKAIAEYRLVVDNPAFASYQRMDQILFYLSYLLTQTGVEDVARVYFNRLIKDYPSSPYLPHAYVSFGRYFFDQGDFENAEAFLRRAAANPSPIRWYAQYLLGWCASRRGDYAGALALFQRAGASTSLSKDEHLQIARSAAFAAARSKGAAETIAILQRLSPSDHTPLRAAANVYSALQQPAACEAVKAKLSKEEAANQWPCRR